METKFKNHELRLRVSEKMKLNIKKISIGLEFKQPDCIRFLLNKSIREINLDAIKCGGFQNLEIAVKNYDN